MSNKIKKTNKMALKSLYKNFNKTNKFLCKTFSIDSTIHFNKYKEINTFENSMRKISSKKLKSKMKSLLRVK